MNDDFIQHAINNGKDGSEWLKNIPTIIATCEKQWNIQVSSPFNLNYNYVAPAKRHNGSDVVLKIGFPKDKEFQTEIEALKVFDGNAIEKILEVDEQHSAILIERIVPGIPLSTIADDDEATKIIASIIKKLHKPLPQNYHFIPIAEWTNALSHYRKQYPTNGLLPHHLIEKAYTVFEELFATSEPPVLVHGDLHHDNILSSHRKKWLAIDPKGIAAEPAYETAAMIRNPYEKLRHISDLKPILERRIAILSQELSFDPTRIHKWCFAQTVLSAVWNHTEVKGSHHAIRVAEALDALF